MTSHFPEVTGFGNAEPDWPAIPEKHTVPEVAARYLRHRISAYVRSRNITGADLAAELGDTEAAWRSRLNTTRGLNTDDLVALFLLFPDLADVVIPRSADLDDWLPPSYAGLASRPGDGSGLPVFRLPEIEWQQMSSEVAQWWSAAVADGTAFWSIDSRVLVHHVLQRLDHFGLPRQLAAPAGTVATTTPPALRTSSTRIDWMTRDVSVTVVWLDPFAEPDSSNARTLLGAAGDALWSDRSDTLPTDVTVIAAPAAVIASIRDVCQGQGGDPQRAVVLSLAHAQRLGATEPGSRPDLQVAGLDNGTGPLLWLQIKG